MTWFGGLGMLTPRIAIPVCLPVHLLLFPLKTAFSFRFCSLPNKHAFLTSAYPPSTLLLPPTPTACPLHPEARRRIPHRPFSIPKVSHHAEPEHGKAGCCCPRQVSFYSCIHRKRKRRSWMKTARPSQSQTAFVMSSVRSLRGVKK